MSDKKYNIIITAGPTNEKIDAVMKITNMSTGALGARIAETCLTDPEFSKKIGKIFYISPKLARKPDIDQPDKLKLVNITDAASLKDILEQLLLGEKIHAVIHSCAVGDYKARYTARAEDIAKEIIDALDTDGTLGYGRVLQILEHPKCVQNDNTKISSYEPNLMTMMDLTPKVIDTVKKTSPDTLLVGFKLLENVPDQHLFQVASKLRRHTGADYIVANDLSRIGGGRHPAMVIGKGPHTGEDVVFATPQDKDHIARDVLNLILLDLDLKYDDQRQD